ncbi:MATE family efflux transporter [Microvirga mediterraneensis]|uniref:Polysaccharide biosynthesis C-terminal domain-containing protein n=1 Tax=Microvirga mediterraneensis TaxID=2754695 RepID=A0A838BRC9_9HYPH|nr:MATE family efflux transporter [Microvirga mediterraneensis]MBA1158344.1 polysaccharide biosynthesis C-terminal domain-containing protein [Microvirga mediterraneensis]
MDSSPSLKPADPPNEPPRFVVGSTMRHVLVMTGTGAAGLVAIFIVDLVSLLYISWLNDPSLTAGVGLATVVMFFTISINVGLMIPIGALVSRALGARRPSDARRLATSCSILMAAVAALVSLIILPLLPMILTMIGASEQTYEVARNFLWIALPTNVLMAIGMAFSTVLRAAGDAKRSMYATLSVAAVTVVLDPILIFGLGLKTNGAAITINIARVAYVYVAFLYLTRAHDLLKRPNWAELIADARPFFAIAIPAILTNIAAPAANAFFTGVMARFGDQAIAASAIIDRVTPVAFAGVFALAGAIGPVLGQNWGAQRYDRMKQTLRDSLTFTIVYVGSVWLLLVLVQVPITRAFNAPPATAEIVQVFCQLSGFIWFFVSLVFMANASFNNLGYPLLSTFFNWGRATLGMIPFAYLGAEIGGPKGALVGIGAGSVVFGIAAVITAFWTIRRLERQAVLAM